jgi:hypothetical protein
MAEPRVIVVGETYSLGMAVAELLTSDGIGTVLVTRFDEAERQASARSDTSPLVLVAAANGPECVTVERWPESSLSEAELVVVGARGLEPSDVPHLHLVSLPLEPGRLLVLVRSLLTRPFSAPPDRSGPPNAVR